MKPYLASILNGSLDTRVLLDVVKYFPPTFSVTQSFDDDDDDDDAEPEVPTGTTALDTFLFDSRGIKLSPADTYSTSSSLRTRTAIKLRCY